MYRIKRGPSHRIAQLARLGQEIFHTSDLAILWKIKDPNTLYTTLRRYTQKGLLFRIYKGMYSFKPICELDPLMLGLKALHRFAYVSTETVLFQHGVILQNVSSITLVSDISKRFEIDSSNYVCRRLNDKYLHNSAGITVEHNVKVANITRAIADLLYFNPRAYLDGTTLVNWNDVRALQKQIGYPLTPHQYDASKSK